jgi:benzodiazapine receptor
MPGRGDNWLSIYCRLDPRMVQHAEQALIQPAQLVVRPGVDILYVLMGFSAYFVWTSGSKDVRPDLYVFGLQLVLNTIWSLIFFGLRNPFYAFVEIILLWVAIVLTILRFYKVRKAAAYLMIPYICWVTFAALLNYEVWRMNG